MSLPINSGVTPSVAARRQAAMHRTSAVTTPTPDQGAPVTDRSEVQASPEPQVQRTASGVVTHYQKSLAGTALKAALPAGTLLPAAVVLNAFTDNQGNTQVSAQFADDPKSKPLETGVTNDGVMYVNPDPKNANAPLLMFDPGNNDYGLVSKEEVQGDGSRRFLLQETVHADGSQTLIQDHNIAADGGRSYNQVERDTGGNVTSAKAVTIAGGIVQQTPLTARFSSNAVSLNAVQPAAEPPAAQQGFMGVLRGLFTSEHPDPATAQRASSSAFRTFSTAMNFMRQNDEPVDFMESFVPKSSMPTKVRVQRGDMLSLPAEGVATTINSEGEWFGGIDRALRSRCGTQYEEQARARMPLTDGDVFIAERQQEHSGNFEKVLYMVDDFKSPIDEVLYKGLKAADAAGMESINLPTFRMGVMARHFDPEETIALTAKALRRFQSENPENLKTINLVVRSSSEVASKFERALR